MDLLSQNRTHHITQESMSLLPNYFRWMYRIYVDYIRGTVLELGCGAGLGLRYLGPNAEEVYAVDHNAELLTRAASVELDCPLHIAQSDLTGDWSELSNIRADTIVAMDVLEHFEDDHYFLQHAKSLLKRDGHIIFKVPAQSKLYGAVDTASGHFRRYDKDDIYSLASHNGLCVKELRSINVLGSLAYRFKRDNTSSFSKTFEPWQLQLINRLMPIIGIIDGITPGIGLSYICVLKATQQA